jgi:hypothetical protein
MNHQFIPILDVNQENHGKILGQQVFVKPFALPAKGGADNLLQFKLEIVENILKGGSEA